MIRRALLLALLAAPGLLGAGAPALAASKIAIAALGDGAPGGGVFAGPSFVSEPAAAGDGWIAFRSLVIDRSEREQIIVTNLVTTAERSVVASIGQTVSKEVGTIKQFLGRPAVNARGEVAFAAEITPPDDAPKPDPLKPAPAPAGVFLYSQGALSVIAAPGFDTGFGILDLTTPVNTFTAESGVDIAERSPALNDLGDVAFVSSTTTGTGSGGAIFVKRAGQPLAAAVKLGDPFGGGTFQVLGPPALNNVGGLAFRGVVDASGLLDGVFTLNGAALTLLIRDGDTPEKLPAPFEIDPLFEFGDVVALNDAGDVACTGGPIFDNSTSGSLGSLEGSLGVIVIPAGRAPLLIGYPGQPVEVSGLNDRIFEVTLGPEEGSRTPAPGLTPDGKVIFVASINNGGSEAIFRADAAAGAVRPLVRLGGKAADATPVGGTYLSASSAPAVDAKGNIVFDARIEGTTTSQVLVWRPVIGEQVAIKLGDAVPVEESGFFGGPAFFAPQLNDAGDVAFKAYMTAGPSAFGIFRYRAGALAPIVRVRDVVPIEGAPAITNLVGDIAMNAGGDVAFAATVEGTGRGIFVGNGSALRPVAMTFDDLLPEDPKREGAFIKTIAAGPSIADDGAVVFRGVIQYESRFGPLFPDVRENCVFLADAAGIRVIAAEGQDSGTGRPFLNFRDPAILRRSVLFRAPLGAFVEERVGLFLGDDAGVRPVVVEGQTLGGMTLDALQGKGSFDASGNVYFSAKVREGQKSSGAVIRGEPGGFATVVQTGVPGPEGGRVRSLGRPSVNGQGRVALRVGFDPFSGGVPGVFVAGADGLRPLLRIGEGGAAGLGGRITSLNQNVALNSADQVALLASLGGGRARSAIMLAAPATLAVQRLAFQRGRGLLAPKPPAGPADRVRFTASLAPGSLPAPIVPEDQNIEPARRKTVTVAVADTRGTLWSATVPSSDTVLTGRTLSQKPGAKEKTVGALRVKFDRRGALRIAVRSRAFTLPQGLRAIDEQGSVVLEPPFSVRVDVGEDGASAVVPCTPRGRRFRCRG